MKLRQLVLAMSGPYRVQGERHEPELFGRERYDLWLRCRRLRTVAWCRRYARSGVRHRFVTLGSLVIVPLMAFALWFVTRPACGCPGRIELAKTSMQTLRSSIKTWKLQNTETDECPTFERLRAAHLTDGTATDPWGSPYVWTCTDEDVIVLSFGRDRHIGTEDDIRVPPPPMNLVLTGTQ